MSSLPVAAIADVSNSRKHPDRLKLQRDIEHAFARVNTALPSEQPLRPTIGDEFQAVYANLSLALRATLLAQLFLPEGVECRFGLGSGEIVAVGTSAVGRIQDGSAWWAAREAIVEARSREYSRHSFVRTWFSAAEMSEDATKMDLVNAFLLCRDQILSGANARERRLLLGQLQGTTQSELAQREGISQSAVSQSLRRSGSIALLASEKLLAGART